MRDGSAGFTLVEVLVSLALFAVIGGAGVAVLDQVLRTQTRTELRMERLSALQRGMYVLSQDLAQARAGSVGLDDDVLTLQHEALTIHYSVQDGALLRQISGKAKAVQTLLGKTEAVSWMFLDAQDAWLDHWPDAPAAEGTDAIPRAVAVTVFLSDNTEIRRVVPLLAKAE